MNEASMIINVTNRKMIYSHSHKELFDWAGRKDPKRYSLTENTNRGNKYTTTTQLLLTMLDT